MFLVDTSVVSVFVRNNPLKERYRAEIESAAPLFVSVQTVAELMAGADRDRWGAARQAALRRFVEKQFTIMPMTDDTVAFYVAALNGSARAGRMLTVADAWIVATAMQYGLVLVSHDKDMIVGEKLGVQIVCRAPTARR